MGPYLQKLKDFFSPKNLRLAKNPERGFHFETRSGEIRGDNAFNLLLAHTCAPEQTEALFALLTGNEALRHPMVAFAESDGLPGLMALCESKAGLSAPRHGLGQNLLARFCVPLADRDCDLDAALRSGGLAAGLACSAQACPETEDFCASLLRCARSLLRLRKSAVVAILLREAPADPAVALAIEELIGAAKATDSLLVYHIAGFGEESQIFEERFDAVLVGGPPRKQRLPAHALRNTKKLLLGPLAKKLMRSAQENPETSFAFCTSQTPGDPCLFPAEHLGSPPKAAGVPAPAGGPPLPWPAQSDFPLSNPDKSSLRQELLAGLKSPNF